MPDHAYHRDNPSPEYRAMVAMYETLHREGEQQAGKSADETFPGKMLISHAPGIRDMVQRTGARSIIDYGAGKGLGYEQRDLRLKNGETISSIQDYWGVDSVRCYDPGYEPFAELPTEPCDGVISTDVLEHITEPDVPWVIDEMFSLATRFVYANIACFPAVKSLPNGQNAHCTVRPPEWWAGVVHAVAMRHTNVAYRFVMSTKTGRRKKMGFARNRKTEHQFFERFPTAG
jgi:hypothetical protein